MENVKDYMYGVLNLVKYLTGVSLWLVATGYIGYGAVWLASMHDYGHTPNEYQVKFSFCVGVIVEMIVGMCAYMIFDIVTDTVKARRAKRQ